jgi:hypothetical protein
MNLTGIISISGFPGLFKIVAQSKNGVIVESLVDKKKMPAYSTYKISALEDISIFGQSEDTALTEILKKIDEKEKGKAISLDTKTASESELKNYLSAVYPDYDSTRVHASDIKKMLNWYNLLQKNDLLKAKEEDKAVAETEDDTKTKAAKLKDVKEKGTSAKPAAKAKTVAPKAKTSASKAPKTSTIRKTGA